jgi:hypothetical protein
MNRFVRQAYITSSSRDPLFESLVSAVCLWGSHLSSIPSLKRYESAFLSKAIQDVSSALFLASSEQHGHGIIRVIQAEVLLANYFFSFGRFLEGRYHSTAATSLAITCKLYALGATQDVNMLGMNLVRGSYTELMESEVGDVIDHGECINAFWAVYALDKCWSVALASPSSISENSISGIQIITPWPLAIAQYEQVRHHRELSGYTQSDIQQGQTVAFPSQPVVTEFLNSPVVGSLEYCSPLALRAKACILFSRASSLASRFDDSTSLESSFFHAFSSYLSRTDMPNQHAFWREFAALDNLITSFINYLPHLLVISPGDALETLVACTIAQVAVIQLHVRFSKEQAGSRDSCIAAANSILATVQNLNINTLGYLDPIMAVSLPAGSSHKLVSDVATGADPPISRLPGIPGRNPSVHLKFRAHHQPYICERPQVLDRPHSRHYDRLQRRLSPDGSVFLLLLALVQVRLCSRLSHSCSHSGTSHADPRSK